MKALRASFFTPLGLAATLAALCALALFMRFSSPAFAAKGGQTNINVCHITGDGTYRSITVAEPALPAHLDHGDAVPGGSCMEGVGACEATGALICTAEGVVCDAEPGTPTEEVCDAIDNDCDALTDEDIASVPTTCGVGACAATGEATCTNGTTSDSCTPGAPAADDSVCNAIDDDCDGTTDEDFASTGTTCGVGACQNTGGTSCTEGTVTDSCTPLPPSTEVCDDSIDNDCDGLVDLADTTDCGA